MFQISGSIINIDMSFPLLRYFAPRPPLTDTENVEVDENDHTLPPPPPSKPTFDGVARFMGLFERTPAPPHPPDRSIRCINDCRCQWSQLAEQSDKLNSTRIHAEKARWQPQLDGKISGAANCTMILYGLAKTTLEERLRAELGGAALVRSVRVVRENDGCTSRGYAFAVFHCEADMLSQVHAWRKGRLVDGRLVHGDIRRGGVEVGWVPNRMRWTSFVQPPQRQQRGRHKRYRKT